MDNQISIIACHIKRNRIHILLFLHDNLQSRHSNNNNNNRQHYLHHWRTVLFLLNSSNYHLLNLVNESQRSHIHSANHNRNSFHGENSSESSSGTLKNEQFDSTDHVMGLANQNHFTATVSVIRWYTRSGFCKDVNRRQ